MKNLHQAFRLAIREEGDFVNAYVVMHPTEWNDALLVGSIRRTMLDDGGRNSQQFVAWKNLLKRSLDNHMAAVGITDGMWKEAAPPKNEGKA
ncbi:MAG: hypothetical protein HC889_00530 [Synechococcaceae cyanobacterium SM1_2_3]|nr:hypothetical protein [Synechococcaceae cyanobacterium SM1_2_3]